jgi:hypothetical protein
VYCPRVCNPVCQVMFFVTIILHAILSSTMSAMCPTHLIFGVTSLILGGQSELRSSIFPSLPICPLNWTGGYGDCQLNWTGEYGDCPLNWTGEYGDCPLNWTGGYGDCPLITGHSLHLTHTVSCSLLTVDCFSEVKVAGS